MFLPPVSEGGEGANARVHRYLCLGSTQLGEREKARSELAAFSMSVRYDKQWVETWFYRPLWVASIDDILVRYLRLLPTLTIFDFRSATMAKLLHPSRITSPLAR